MSRRAVLRDAGAMIAAASTNDCGAPPGGVVNAPTNPALEGLEASIGGRVGVFAMDTGTGRELAHRADERFAMCSTFKWALAAAVLQRIDRGELTLDQEVPYGEADLLEYAPVTRANVASGAMTVSALAEAAVTVSDNTAANLLLAHVDGPPGLTRFFRTIGDDITRLDRNEPTLNINEPGDPRDTTSPRAMVGALRAVLLGDALSPSSGGRLATWMKACRTGLDRLRAGLPTDWTVGDKTGTGMRGAANDVAIAWRPMGAPIVIASYLSDGPSAPSALNAAHRAIALAVAGAIAQGTLDRGRSPGETKPRTQD